MPAAYPEGRRTRDCCSAICGPRKSLQKKNCLLRWIQRICAERSRDLL